MKNTIIPLVLSGGVGFRLWPIARVSKPKQLINFGNNKTMLRNTLIRLSCIKGIEKPVVICSHKCKFTVIDHFKQMGVDDFSVIVEPVGRNTAPALTAAILKLVEFEKLDCVCLVVPADHHITDILQFKEAIQSGVNYADNGHIVTFGVVPTYPETGYGYIKKGNTLVQAHDCNSNYDLAAVLVKKFIEKPDFNTATEYLKSEEYYWNSGIYMFRSSKMLENLTRFVPEIVESCRSAIREGIEESNSFYLGREAFIKCPEDSIDCAVMEKSAHSVMIPLDVEWKDLGTWESLYQISEKDGSGNVVKGDVKVHNSTNSYIRSEDRLIVAVGINNHILVETNDSVLIAPFGQAQNIKRAVYDLRQNNRKEFLEHTKQYCSWGSYEILFSSDILDINFVVVKPGHFFCVQEYFELGGKWIVINGNAGVENKGSMFYLTKKESICTKNDFEYIFHNLERGKISLELVELNSKS